MKTIVPLVRASHFQPTVAVTAIATALAIQVGRGTGAWWVLLAVLSGQLSVGWSNDYLDRQRDSRSSRTDKPIVAGQVSASLVGTCAVVALILCVPLSLFSGWRAGSLHLIAVALAWAYNFKLKATIASAVPYAVAFGLLPVCVTLGLSQHPWPRPWAIVAASLLGLAAHFVNVLPDLESDRHTGINGMPQRVGYVASLIIGALLIASSMVVVALFTIDSERSFRIGFLVLSIVGAMSIFISGFFGRTRLAWTMTLCLAGLAVAALIANGSSLVSG